MATELISRQDSVAVIVEDLPSSRNAKADTKLQFSHRGPHAMADAAKDAANGASAEVTQTPKAIIKNVDMSEDMQQLAVDIAQDALAKFTVEKDIAAHIKRTMDQRIGPTWHAVVGRNCECESI